MGTIYNCSLFSFWAKKFAVKSTHATIITADTRQINIVINTFIITTFFIGLNIRFSVVGYWILAIGNGLLAMGFRNRVQRYCLKLTKLVISSKKSKKKCIFSFNY